jgi:hypothetical protein
MNYELNDRVVVILSDDRYFMQHGIVIQLANNEVKIRLDSGIKTWVDNEWICHEK